MNSEAANPIPFRFDALSTARAAWIMLALLVISNAPLFVCMPLTSDTELFDLQARILAEGGTLYRDIFEPNLPGVVWIHVAIRSLVGASSEAMRIVDLFLFGVMAFLVTRWIRSSGRPAATQAWTVVILVFLYLSISEWNHCQRDVWLLIPSLAALHLRRMQILRLSEPAGARAGNTLAWALCEGLCWGAAVWIKPMIVVPAAVGWIAGAVIVRRFRPICVDFFGLLAGGLLMGGAGILWLWGCGAWPYFFEIFTQWNPRYFAAGKENWTAVRFVGMCIRFFPWILLHLVAVPVAIGNLIQAFRARRDETDLRVDARRQALLLYSAFYLAWLVQSFFLQHLFDYVHAPGMLLAIGLLGIVPPAIYKSRFWRPAIMGFLGIAWLVTPVVHQDRLECWLTCITQGGTPEVQTKLSQLKHPNWHDVDRVATFLKKENLKDGELTCYDTEIVRLYSDLGIRPSSRYVYLACLMSYFPDQRATIRRSVIDSPQRYIVTDLRGTQLPASIINAVGPEGELSLPPGFPERARKVFPWSYPIVFRAGTLLVHRVEPAAIDTPTKPPQMATAQSSARRLSATSHAEKN
jgi:hypothetical protein